MCSSWYWGLRVVSCVFCPEFSASSYAPFCNNCFVFELFPSSVSFRQSLFSCLLTKVIILSTPVFHGPCYSPCCLAGIPWTLGRIAEVSSLPSGHLPCEWGNFMHPSGVPSYTAPRALLFEGRTTRSQESLGMWCHWDQDLREEVWTWLVCGGKGWGHSSTILFPTRHRQAWCSLIITTTPLHCSSLSPPQNSSNGQCGKLCLLPVSGDTKNCLGVYF